MCSFMWGGFFCINRLGKLELRKYGVTPVMEIDNRHRLSSSFSDFITRYTAVSSTNMKTQTAEYYALNPDDGLTMNLGVNPMGAYFSETEYDSGGVWTGNLMYSITFKNSSVWIKKVELIMKKKNRVIHKCSNL